MGAGLDILLGGDKMPVKGGRGDKMPFSGVIRYLFLRGDRGAEKEGKTESSPLEEAQAGPVATDDVRVESFKTFHSLKKCSCVALVESFAFEKLSGNALRVGSSGAF